MPSGHNVLDYITNQKIIPLHKDNNSYSYEILLSPATDQLLKISAVLCSWCSDLILEKNFKPIAITRVIYESNQVNLIRNLIDSISSSTEEYNYKSILLFNCFGRLIPSDKANYSDNILYYYDKDLKTLFVSFSRKNLEGNENDDENDYSYKEITNIGYNNFKLYNNFSEEHVYNIFQQVTKDIEEIKKLLTSQELEINNITFSGHGKGGKLAEMIFQRYYNDYNKKPELISLYTFGIPSIEQDYNQNYVFVKSIINKNDSVVKGLATTNNLALIGVALATILAIGYFKKK